MSTAATRRGRSWGCVVAVEADLYTRLTSSTDVTSQVSDRVYPLPLPQEATIPALTWQKISGPREHAMGQDPGEAHSRFQLDCWGESLNDTLAIRDGLLSGLSRWSSSTGSVTVYDVFLINEQQSYEDDARLHRVRLDFMIHHTE